MVHQSVIEARLSKLGIRCGWLSRPELIELQRILMDGEEIISLANGRYFAGFATMVATDIRMLIIDKRPFFLTVEDIRYDMISEMDFSARLLDATLRVYTVNKQHRFTSFRYREHLRRLTAYVQQRVMELRMAQSQQQTAAAPVATVQAQVPEPPPNPEPPTHTGLPPEPAPQPPKTYRHIASKLSGRLLGPVAVQAAHSHWHGIANPYTKASLAVRHNSSWFSSHRPHIETPQAMVAPNNLKY